MDPTDVEIASFTTIAKVAAWAQFDGLHSDDKTPWGSFLALFGLGPVAHPRVIGATPVADFNTLIATWQIDGNPPTPAQATIAGIFGRTCRITAGTEDTIAQQKKDKEDTRAHDLAVLQAKAASSAGIASGASKAQRVVKMSTVISQISEQEVVVLTPTVIKDGYRRYRKIFGIDPPPGAELTAEQLSGLHSIITDSSQPVPYVDFSVWGPHGHRVEKRVKLGGMTFDEKGNLRYIEINGPANFKMWEQSNECLKTGLIMLDSVDLGNLVVYRNVIKDFNEEFGSSMWYLVYQAENRMRLEGMDRLRRQAERSYDAAVLAGTQAAHPYDPNRPWNYIWQLAAEDEKFWKRELEKPALAVLTRTQTLASVIDEDSKIDFSKVMNDTGKSMDIQRSPKRLREQHDNYHDTQVPQVKVHRFVNGAYTHNRAETPLCEGFNNGSCSAKGIGTRCGNNPALAHHCNKCLSPDHGAHENKCTRGPPSTSKGSGKSNGKKGGKKGGKGGKKRSWY